MTAPNRSRVEEVLGRRLLQWQWDTLLGILGYSGTHVADAQVVDEPAPQHHGQDDDVVHQPSPRPRPGRLCLTPQQDTEIANRYAAGESVRSLAESFGVSVPTVYNAIKRAAVTITRAASDIPAKPFPLKVTPLPESAPAPPPAPRKPTPGVTAHCTDCTRTFTLTGRVLQQAADLHELKHGHIVIFEEGAI